MRRQPARALLVELDGVLRRRDPAVIAGVEAAHGLPTGALLDTTMSWELLRPAVSGELTHEQWMGLVVERLPGDRAAAAAAVAQWQAYRGEVDPDVLGLLRQVRAAGLPVGVATNGTDRLDEELAGLGLTDEVDVVVNSWAIGIHKPAPEFYARACEAIGVAAPWVMFIDESDRDVRAARAGKLLAYRWSGPAGLGYVRAAVGC